MEKWKKIKDYPNYMVSDKGNVKSLSRCEYWLRFGKTLSRVRKDRVLKLVKTSTGYPQVGLANKNGQRCFHVHRLVAETFIKNPKNKPQVNHKDGDKKNNNIYNLEWVTRSEQMQHSFKVLGNNAWHKGITGEDTPTSKPVLQKTIDGNIIKRWGCGLDAVREGGFDSSCISRCCSGEYRTHSGYIWEYEK